MPSFETCLFDPAQDERHLPALAQMHKDSVLVDGQAMTLLPPLTDEKLLAFWRKQVASVESGELLIILATATTDDAAGEREIAGAVCLRMPCTETGPFRGEVLSLMVSLKYRQRGIARLMMTRLENEVRLRKRYLLILDTSIGTPAEKHGVYTRLGYTECGIIPKYAISPVTGELMDEKLFYKDLRDS